MTAIHYVQYNFARPHLDLGKAVRARAAGPALHLGKPSDMVA